MATDEDSPVSGNVLLNDTDVDGDTLTVSSTGLIVTASGALVSMNANGDFVYDPNGQFDSLNDGETVVDTFSYEVSDGNGGSATAEVSVTVAGITDAQPVVVTIGNAPSRVSRRDPDAWEDAWTDDLVEISHKQDVTDALEKLL